MLTISGRSLHSCQIAFEDMKRQLSQQSTSFRPMVPTAYVNIAPQPPSGTNRSVSENNASQFARTLHPRPPHRSTESPNPTVTNGGSPTLTRHVGMEPLPEPTTRKRGRPSKVEVEERTRRLALEGKEYQPKKRPAKRIRSSLPPDGLGAKEEYARELTPLLQTPSTTQIELAEDGSSGKRRSRRQTRGEATPEPTNTEGFSNTSLDGSGLEVHVAESPSDRLLARGSVGSSLSRPTQQGSDNMDQRQSDFAQI